MRLFSNFIPRRARNPARRAMLFNLFDLSVVSRSLNKWATSAIPESSTDQYAIDWLTVDPQATSVVTGVRWRRRGTAGLRESPVGSTILSQPWSARICLLGGLTW
jgi:hypothetical protein